MITAFKSLDYNIPKQTFWTSYRSVSGISDMVALMEVKTEKQQIEFRIYKDTTAQLSCGGMRNKEGIITKL